MDNNLAAGPDQAVLAEPGATLYRSDTGGEQWSTTYQNPTGIWSFDLFSATKGWVVNVTSLVTTDDGGAHWTTLGEPQGASLVQVEFLTATTGYGITSTGGLVSSADGGSSWRPIPWDHPIAAMCSTGGRLYVADQVGEVLTISQEGGSPVKANNQTFVAPPSSMWISLSCEADTAAMYELDTAAPSNGGGTEPFEVLLSTDDGKTWPVVADSGADQRYDIPPVPATLLSISGILATVDGVSVATANNAEIDWVTIGPSGKVLTPEHDVLFQAEGRDKQDRVSVGGLGESGSTVAAEINLVGFAANGVDATITPVLATSSSIGTQWRSSRGEPIAVAGGG